MNEIIDLLQDMVANGHAPASGCSLFGVGYEDGFSRLKRVILENRLKANGKSVEKFIIGPYGSGKTHFMRQLIEIGREAGFVTSEVQLSKDINIAENLIVFTEVARNINAPGQKKPGIRGLLEISIDKMRDLSEDPSRSDEMVEMWVDRLKSEVAFENNAFQRILLGGIKAYIADEEERFDKSCRWLAGEVSNSKLSNELNVSKIGKQESNRFGETALLSLCQFLREAGFPGTIIGYDEAEQSASVATRKLDSILSMLRSEMDSITRIKNASLLKVYAFTPNVVQKMMDYPALQQRLSNPDPERDFFDGETHAPLIDLSRPFTNASESLKNLQEIGKRLVALFYDVYGNKLKTSHEDLLLLSQSWAEEISRGTASISNRRDMIKLCSSRLINIYETEIENIHNGDGQKLSQGTHEDEV